MGVPYAEVIGDPIAHSKSPLIHKFWLEKLGMEGDYRAVRVTADTLAGYFAFRRGNPDWRGCNVTMPLKQAVLDHSDDRTVVDDEVGAANLLIPINGALYADNTDAGGFLEPWRDRFAAAYYDGSLAEFRIIVIGTGGAARAVLASLGDWVGSFALVSRNPPAAERLLAEFEVNGIVLHPGEPLPSGEVLVNASPLGMQGMPALEIDLSPLPDNALVYDMVYQPLETDLLRQARARGLATIDGLAMLIGQADLSFHCFFHEFAPREHDSELRALLTS